MFHKLKSVVVFFKIVSHSAIYISRDNTPKQTITQVLRTVTYLSAGMYN